MMVKISEKLKCCIISVSFQARRKRALERYRQRATELENMERDEIDLEYINKKSGYEHKKRVLSVFMIAIAVSVLMEAWNSFYKFMVIIVQYATELQDDGVQAAQTAFAISTILVVFITAIVFILLVIHTREMQQIYRDLMIIEIVRKQKDQIGDRAMSKGIESYNTGQGKIYL